jgi:2-polyprenyl-3-methyl-5-hydroxy-6-metoxy-1,4-benzoquinol methylase
MEVILITRDEILTVFRENGGTDIEYLEAHLARFLNTYHQFDSHWDRNRGLRMLDIGAHWLHQSSVFRLGGYEVTAADVPNTFELESVQALAGSLGIELLSYTDLSVEGSLSAIASDSMNVILMAEIIEHITFNPVELWKEIYRVMAPGGRIVVTTPNYYWAGGRAWAWKRFLTGFGGGISTSDILNIHTMGHHWKEFSLRELQHYFCLLSPDFDCVKGEYTSDEDIKNSAFQKRFKWFRQGIHLEIEVAEKSSGITVVPGW